MSKKLLNELTTLEKSRNANFKHYHYYLNNYYTSTKCSTNYIVQYEVAAYVACRDWLVESIRST